MQVKDTTYPVINEGKTLRTVDLSGLTIADFRKVGFAWTSRFPEGSVKHFGNITDYKFSLDEDRFFHLKFAGGFVDLECRHESNHLIVIRDIYQRSFPDTLNHVLMASEKIKRNSSRGRLQENLRPYAELVPAYNELIYLLLGIKGEDRKAFNEDT